MALWKLSFILYWFFFFIGEILMVYWIFPTLMAYLLFINFSLFENHFWLWRFGVLPYSPWREIKLCNRTVHANEYFAMFSIYTPFCFCFALTEWLVYAIPSNCCVRRSSAYLHCWIWRSFWCYKESSWWSYRVWGRWSFWWGGG
jgi:hypothetical protein